MKILHTSDWHLGQSFFTKTRADEHQQFFTWLLQLVAQEHIDAIVVAGDIFDTGTPPSYARTLYHQFVCELQSYQCSLVVLGGNHDAVSVLNESRDLLKFLHCHVVASTAANQQEQVFVLNDKTGNPGAILCAIPFIRPRDVLKSQAGEGGADKRVALGDAIKQHYAALYSEAKALQSTMTNPVPIIATGHLTALGVKTSDSVRDIYIGNLEGFAADGFPPADYIALGHIHRPQVVARQPHIRYSGSPIPLSFDELKSQKQVVVVTLNKGDVSSISPVNVPLFQPMAVVRGNMDTLSKEIDLALTKHSSVIDSLEKALWLCVEIDTQDYLSDLQQRVLAITEGKPVEILQLRRVRNKTLSGLSQQHKETLAELSVTDVFNERLDKEAFDTEPEQARKTRIKTLFQTLVSEVELAQVDNGESE